VAKIADGELSQWLWSETNLLPKHVLGALNANPWRLLVSWRCAEFWFVVSLGRQNQSCQIL